MYLKNDTTTTNGDKMKELAFLFIGYGMAKVSSYDKNSGMAMICIGLLFVLAQYFTKDEE